MHPLVKGDLEEIPGVHGFRIVFDHQQVRFFIVVSDAHHARMGADCVRYSGATVMIHRFTYVNYYVSHIHNKLLAADSSE